MGDRSTGAGRSTRRRFGREPAKVGPVGGQGLSPALPPSRERGEVTQAGAAVREDALSDLHPMAELLASCPGMTKEHVYYLEQRGYIRPIKQRHGKIERNLYTSDQAQLVKAIWRHRQAGLPPREAYQRALREQSRGQLSMWPEGAAEA